MDSITKLILGVVAILMLAISLIACRAKATPSSLASAEAGASTVSNTADAVYQKLSAPEAQARMDSGQALIILDVRTPEEYAEAYIKNAINLPLDQITRDAATVLPDKGAEILVYCRSGNRSKTAAQQLIKLGYTRVFDFGGIKDWTGETLTK